MCERQRERESGSERDLIVFNGHSTDLVTSRQKRVCVHKCMFMCMCRTNIQSEIRIRKYWQKFETNLKSRTCRYA